MCAKVYGMSVPAAYPLDPAVQHVRLSAVSFLASQPQGLLKSLPTRDLYMPLLHVLVVCSSSNRSRTGSGSGAVLVVLLLLLLLLLLPLPLPLPLPQPLPLPLLLLLLTTTTTATTYDYYTTTTMTNTTTTTTATATATTPTPTPTPVALAPAATASFHSRRTSEVHVASRRAYPGYRSRDVYDIAINNASADPQIQHAGQPQS